MNFCSQCIYAGGVREDNIWYKNSVAFINIIKFIEHFSKKRGTNFIENPDINNIDPGDIVFLESMGNRYGHAMFVTYKEDYFIRCCSNTTDRQNMALTPSIFTGVIKTSLFIN